MANPYYTTYSNPPIPGLLGFITGGGLARPVKYGTRPDELYQLYVPQPDSPRYQPGDKVSLGDALFGRKRKGTRHALVATPAQPYATEWSPNSAYSVIPYAGPGAIVVSPPPAPPARQRSTSSASGSTSNSDPTNTEAASFQPVIQASPEAPWLDPYITSGVRRGHDDAMEIQRIARERREYQQKLEQAYWKGYDTQMRLIERQRHEIEGARFSKLARMLQKEEDLRLGKQEDMERDMRAKAEQERRRRERNLQRDEERERGKGAQNAIKHAKKNMKQRSNEPPLAFASRRPPLYDGHSRRKPRARSSSRGRGGSARADRRSRGADSDRGADGAGRRGQSDSRRRTGSAEASCPDRHPNTSEGANDVPERADVVQRSEASPSANGQASHADMPETSRRDATPVAATTEGVTAAPPAREAPATPAVAEADDRTPAPGQRTAASSVTPQDDQRPTANQGIASDLNMPTVLQAILEHVDKSINSVREERRSKL